MIDHEIAIAYGLGNPDNVLTWTRQRFDEAVIRLRAKGGYKLTQQEIEDMMKQKAEEKPNNGFILGLSFSFWHGFIKENGELDTSAILQKGYTDDQISYIYEEMVKADLIDDYLATGSQE